MPEKVKYLLAPSLVIVAFDQITKSLAAAKLDPSDPISLIWTLQLNITRNSGASFSLGSGSGITPILASLAILVACVITYLAWSEKDRKLLISYGVVLGGVLGNVLDRIFRSGEGFLGGEVVDFIDLQWWPIFNIADMALVIGIPFLLLFRYREEPNDA